MEVKIKSTHLSCEIHKEGWDCLVSNNRINLTIGVKMDHLQASYEQAFKQNQELEAMVAALAKEARRVLVLTGAWQQEYDGNEILAVVAMYQATKTVVAQKESALSIAIEFIGSFETDPKRSAWAIDTLEKINQALVSETIQQSIDKKESTNETSVIQMS